MWPSTSRTNSVAQRRRARRTGSPIHSIAASRTSGAVAEADPSRSSPQRASPPANKQRRRSVRSGSAIRSGTPYAWIDAHTQPRSSICSSRQVAHSRSSLVGDHDQARRAGGSATIAPVQRRDPSSSRWLPGSSSSSTRRGRVGSTANASRSRCRLPDDSVADRAFGRARDCRSRTAPERRGHGGSASAPRLGVRTASVSLTVARRSS